MLAKRELCSCFEKTLLESIYKGRWVGIGERSQKEHRTSQRCARLSGRAALALSSSSSSILVLMNKHPRPRCQMPQIRFRYGPDPESGPWNLGDQGCLFIGTRMEEEEEDKANAERPLMPAVHFLAVCCPALYSSSHQPPLT